MGDPKTQGSSNEEIIEDLQKELEEIESGRSAGAGELKVAKRDALIKEIRGKPIREEATDLSSRMYRVIKEASPLTPEEMQLIMAYFLDQALRQTSKDLESAAKAFKSFGDAAEMFAAKPARKARKAKKKN